MMRMLHFLLVFLPIVVLVQAQNPSGFISIDCGLPENSSYTEQTTGINYISDAKFIDTGVSQSISPTRQQQLAYVRSFPSGVRNCYRINVASGTKYLIRATFYYGNYDGVNQAQSKGIPFISAIELRILNNNTYNTNTTGLSLALLERYDIGSITNSEYRYSDDVYDRVWTPLTFKQWKKLSTTLNPDDLVQSNYRPPAVVMSTAATPVNASALFISLGLQIVLLTNSTSTFTLMSRSASTGATSYQITLLPTLNSTLPPILNAFEIYIVKDFSQPETQQDDRQIASSISKLTMLQYLDLSNNSLSGPIPDFLTHMQSLKVLNLGKNNLTGVVPSGLLNKSKTGSLTLSIEQNPNLCESTSCNQQTDDQKKKKNIVIPVVSSVAGIVVLLAIVAAAIICGLKKRKPRANVNSHVEPNTPNVSQLESKQRQYTFNELTKITNNFDTILGRGGFAIISTRISAISSRVAIDQLQVKLLMRVHHKNLTSLIGYCNEEANIGLIYEYMANGNLDGHLSGKNRRAKFFTWEDRLRIAVDAAQGVEYLHNGCKPPIIHRDVKTTNILLNENFQAKLADFGLSKTFPTDGGTHLSIVVAGTPGYLDPDSMLSNGDVKNIVDSRLHEDFETSSVWKAVEIGMASVSINPARRPNMSDVVNELKECLAIELARKGVVVTLKTMIQLSWYP
ncbi:Serine-threonine/tyrosine-protein kinase, catalytic domain [Sesbania bispinosa]|nr:Serine-threonine/tyrosine-protein kinase, catalytic domain [Sesbania bispinosa]